MIKRTSAGICSVLLGALVGLGAQAGVPAASNPGDGHSARIAVESATAGGFDRASITRGATLTSSAKEVEEGDRLALTATIKSAAHASKVTLQKFEQAVWDWQEGAWVSVKTVGVKARRQVSFNVVATGLNVERYRAVVAYRKAPAYTSKTVAVKVWRWIPLSDYAPYYEVGGAVFGAVALNGHRYAGWGAPYYSHSGAWEARFTPGRHCTAFRGVLGVADISGDGSSGLIKLTADDAIIYESPVLTPGMDVPMRVDLQRPYRFGIQLFDTTPDDGLGPGSVESWPVIGDPAFLCTGV